MLLIKLREVKNSQNSLKLILSFDFTPAILIIATYERELTVYLVITDCLSQNYENLFQIFLTNVPFSKMKLHLLFAIKHRESMN